MKNKKILIYGESHYIKSGYGSINRDLCSRLYNLEYDILEFGFYGHIDYPNKPKWKFIGNAPGLFNQQVSQEETKLFNSNHYNHFGEWRINDVLIWFKPDLIINFLDPWMGHPIIYSPLRKHTKILWVPTIDAYSDNEQWLYDYSQVDYLYTYTDFALNFLKGKKINALGVSAPGVENSTFCPTYNKPQHKKNFGIDPDSRIIGTVMRNQKRKLYPDLFEGFRKFLDICEEKKDNIGGKTYLYLHTSYPDVGFNIPHLLKKYNLSSKVLFTYICTTCGAAFPSFFQEALRVCPNCSQLACKLPSTGVAIAEQALNQIYNLFDIYVQYALAEGVGIPALEAAAAGVHVVASDYSGPEDFKTKIGGTPIPIKGYSVENDSTRDFAVPDNDKLAKALYDLLSLPQSLLIKKGMDARRGILKHYNWDNTVKILQQSINSAQGNWSAPPLFHNSNLNEPQGLNNSQFIQWAILNILGCPELMGSYWALTLLRDLNNGVSFGYDYYFNSNRTGQFTLVNRDLIKQIMVEKRNRINSWEQKRVDPNYQVPNWLLRSIS